MREQRDQIQEYMGGGWVGARRGQNVSESEADMEEKSRWRACRWNTEGESELWVAARVIPRSSPSACLRNSVRRLVFKAHPQASSRVSHHTPLPMFILQKKKNKQLFRLFRRIHHQTSINLGVS